MVKRKLIIIICTAFIVGILIGFVSFQSDFGTMTNADTSYPIDATLVQAYFKVYNTSEASGVAFRSILSYVFVVNITNPSDATLRLTDIQIFQTNLEVFSYQRTFSESNAYWFYPHTSKLVAFTENMGLTESNIGGLNAHPFQYHLGASFASAEGTGHAESLKLNQEMQLKSISSGEYIYGSTFGNETYFRFINDEAVD